MFANLEKFMFIFVSCLFAGIVQAEPLTFSRALELAEHQSPILIANTAQIDAARSSAIPAGALPDPKLFAGLNNFDVSGPYAGTLEADFMTMETIGISQDVPNADKRHARQAVANAEINVVQAQRDVELLAVRRDTAIAWLNLYYLQRKETLLNQLDQENTLLSQIVRAQIAGGLAQPADAVIPQQEAIQIADRRDDLASAEAQFRAKLRQYVGIAADGELAGTPPSLVINSQALKQHLHQHPEFLLFAAQTQKATAEVNEAQSLKKSDWGVAVGFQRRAPQFGNMVSIQFTFDLPISPSTRQDPIILAKQRELDRIDAERDNVLREYIQELDTDMAEYEALSRQIERAKHITLPLLDEKIKLQTASYKGGKGDLTTLLIARRERIDQRLHIIDLENKKSSVAARLYFTFAEGLSQ
ncbi:MAG: hypothetical protein B7Z60_06225 [Ferrovum sp. 37-45-19]|nr:MAG: hypothetical protein B7Z65_06625 [Ferrovum sp. 21-44-67]OYV94174.1 MAG: hypothetical protein B7Z60_06225 [Ferrovum sp. 37-45-19]OZB32931.1 MAG: hypothetical protein B7X47_05410 [Ferrovum sp. 34-44-207]HQT81443.1 TolC family protein [Ferrovaceae bacterium]HQU06330.1 TolC family protein [Ferrovaceae bacterium]